METHENRTGIGFAVEPIAASLALLTLRLWLGVRSLLTGIEKFTGIDTVQKPLLDEFGEPDISGAMVNVKEKVYGFQYYHGLPKPLYDKFAEEPLLPKWALDLYGGVLGYGLIALGIALLLGVAPRTTLFLGGLLYVSLTLGLILIGEDGGIAWLATHVVLVVLALLLVRYSRFALWNRH